MLFVDALGLSISLRTCNTESIAKYISYARLILLGVNDTVAEAVKEAIVSYKEVIDPKRINEELTWYLNTKEHSDIAKAIKWKPIADFM